MSNAGVRSGSHLRRGERGLGLYGWMLVLAMAGAIATVVLPLVGPHMNDRTLGTAVEQWVEQQDLRQMAPGIARREIEKLLRLNGLDLDLKSALKMERTERTTRLMISYEVRTPIVANIDAISTFHHEWQQDL